MNKLSDEYKSTKDDIDHIEGMKKNLEMYKQNVNRLNKELFDLEERRLVLNRNYEEQVNLNGIKEKRIIESMNSLSETSGQLRISEDNIKLLTNKLKSFENQLLEFDNLKIANEKLSIHLSAAENMLLDSRDKVSDMKLKDMEVDYNKLKLSTSCAQCNDNVSKHNKLIDDKDDEIYWYKVAIILLSLVLLGMFIYFLVNDNSANQLNENLITAGVKNESTIDSEIKTEMALNNVQ